MLQNLICKSLVFVMRRCQRKIHYIANVSLALTQLHSHVGDIIKDQCYYLV